MADWKRSRTYCYRCRTWCSDIAHQECPKGKSGSQVLLNIASFRKGCNKCGETWQLENNIFYCPCGNVQSTMYTDSMLVAGYDDRIILEEDNLVYMLRSTGEVVVGQRRFPGIGFDESPPLSNTPKKTNPFKVIGYLAVAIVVMFLVLCVCANLLPLAIGIFRPTAPTSQSIPQLASSYQGTGHNITYNVTGSLTLSSITEDQQGNISGQVIWGSPLSGSGPFTGTVSSDHSINFTSNGEGFTITYTGTVSAQNTISGNYSTDTGQTGTWQVSATS
jgi:hypothetical protein